MRLNQTFSWIHTHRLWLIDLVRIYLGVGLAIKGVFFLMHPETLLASASTLPPTVVQLVPYIHLIGGLMLAAGIVTQVAAIIQIPILTGAIIAVNLPRMGDMVAREAFEFSSLTLFLLILITIWGPGPLSTDARLARAHGGENGWASLDPDLFMDLIRVYLGVGLFVKGLYILGHQGEFQKLIENTSTMPISLLAVAHYIIPVHFVGGVMLVLGIGTRLAAAAQIPLLLGAIFYVYLPRFSTLELRQNLEFTGLVLFLLCLLALIGSGRYSLDQIVRKHRETEELPEVNKEEKENVTVEV